MRTLSRFASAAAAWRAHADADFLHALETPKDPGIPSEFPYKDQILAEVAEARRKVRLVSPRYSHRFPADRLLERRREGKEEDGQAARHRQSACPRARGALGV